MSFVAAQAAMDTITVPFTANDLAVLEVPGDSDVTGAVDVTRSLTGAVGHAHVM